MADNSRPPATVLTREMLDVAIKAIEENDDYAPCGATSSRPHVVHPKANGWTTCGNCGQFVKVEGRDGR